ncbi:hypothetical protein D3C73_1522530 [compost metagenome]
MMVVVPFSGHDTWPKLIDGFILFIEIDAFPLFIFTFGMAFIIKCTYAYGPEPSCAK